MLSSQLAGIQRDVNRFISCPHLISLLKESGELYSPA